MTIVAVRTSSFIHQYNALFDMMFICAFKAALFIFAKSSYMIKIEAFITLCDTSILFKQFA